MVEAQRNATGVALEALPNVIDGLRADLNNVLELKNTCAGVEGIAEAAYLISRAAADLPAPARVEWMSRNAGSFAAVRDTVLSLRETVRSLNELGRHGGWHSRIPGQRAMEKSRIRNALVSQSETLRNACERFAGQLADFTANHPERSMRRQRDADAFDGEFGSGSDGAAEIDEWEQRHEVVRRGMRRLETSSTGRGRRGGEGAASAAAPTASPAGAPDSSSASDVSEAVTLSEHQHGHAGEDQLVDAEHHTPEEVATALERHLTESIAGMDRLMVSLAELGGRLSVLVETLPHQQSEFQRLRDDILRSVQQQLPELLHRARAALVADTSEALETLADALTDINHAVRRTEQDMESLRSFDALPGGSSADQAARSVSLAALGGEVGAFVASFVSDLGPIGLAAHEATDAGAAAGAAPQVADGTTEPTAPEPTPPAQTLADACLEAAENVRASSSVQEAVAAFESLGLESALRDYKHSCVEACLVAPRRAWPQRSAAVFQGILPHYCRLFGGQDAAVRRLTAGAGEEDHVCSSNCSVMHGEVTAMHATVQALAETVRVHRVRRESMLAEHAQARQHALTRADLVPHVNRIAEQLRDLHEEHRLQLQRLLIEDQRRPEGAAFGFSDS